MKISHDWLRAFVPHTLSPHELGDLLSAHVATVDAVAPLRADLAPFVVARVMESEKIPDTKLSFNKVDDGSGELLEVVCGAPNVVVGTLYPFARTGTVMPAGITIEKRKIRGFTSNGMLCSARELGLGTDHDGILALTVDVPVGTPLLTAMPIGDTQIELDVLPNRPDLLSHYGVAREVSALTNVALGMPAELGSVRTGPGAVKGASSAAAAGIHVSIEDAAGCPRYVAVHIAGVKVGPSPEWLAQRMLSVGSRSINNVVDATNYVLHAFGQPVHAFDAAKLSGKAIKVRKAKAGETLVTLDGTERKLESWMTIIADGQNATALAGVMGGKDSEVTESTTDILLEVALFNPREVRKVRKALNLSTDASYRFERGVDVARTDWMAEQAAALIVAVAGGSVIGIADVGAPLPLPAPVELRLDRLNQLLGDPVPEEDAERLLAAIGFSVEPSTHRSYTVHAPSWRHDVTHEVDLVEEVARLRGFDLLPDELRSSRPGNVPDHPLYITGRRVRDALVAAGLAEVRPMPFTKGPRQDVPYARVANPLAEDEPFLRRALLDTLARRAEYNLNRQQGNVRIFEVGSAFIPDGGTLPREDVRAAILVMGASRPPHFTDAKPPAFDAWDAKALAELLASTAFPGTVITLVPGEGRTLWKIHSGENDIGQVHSPTLDAPVWAASAFGIEITLGVMSSEPVSGRIDPGARRAPVFHAHYTPLPTTPAAEFDLALLVPNDMPAAEVERVIRTASGAMLEAVTLFDEFRGTGVPEGKRSLAWRLTFRHPERTLRDKEIDGRRSQLLKTLETELGVVPRSA